MCKCEFLFKCASVTVNFCLNVNCVNWRARAGPGSFVGRAFRAGPAQMGLSSAVLGQRGQPVGRPGPFNRPGSNGLGLDRAGPGRAARLDICTYGQPTSQVLNSRSKIKPLQ
jgi:hypothetical protein